MIKRQKKLRTKTGVKVIWAEASICYDKVKIYAKSEMAQKYRIAVMVAIAVLSPALKVSIFFMVLILGLINSRDSALYGLLSEGIDGFCLVG